METWSKHIIVYIRLCVFYLIWLECSTDYQTWFNKVHCGHFQSSFCAFVSDWLWDWTSKYMRSLKASFANRFFFCSLWRAIYLFIKTKHIIALLCDIFEEKVFGTNVTKKKTSCFMILLPNDQHISRFKITKTNEKKCWCFLKSLFFKNAS